MPEQGDGTQTLVRPPPVWRYNPAAPFVAGPVQQFVSPGFFASDGYSPPGYGNAAPGPSMRQRPYWRYDGPFMAGVPSGPQTYALTAAGVQASSGQADIGFPAVSPGFFGSQQVAGPANRFRPFWRRATLVAAQVPPVGLWRQDKMQTIVALTTPFTAQNGTWIEHDIGYFTADGGVKWGYMPNYGGGWGSSWYELDHAGVEVGHNNDQLGTSRPDGEIHLATTKTAVFVGTEEGVFTDPVNSELAPAGTNFRAGFQIRVPIAGADTNSFDWTSTDYVYPGGRYPNNPAFRITRIDMHNTNPVTLDGNTGGVGAFEFALVAGLDNTGSEWDLANTGYGTVGGGAPTTPIPSAHTAGQPDYMYAVPGGTAGKRLGIVGVKRTNFVDSEITNAQLLGNTNGTPRTKLYMEGDVTTVAGGGQRLHRVTTAYLRDLTGAQAASIAADVKTPDTAGTFTNISLGTFTAFRDDEGMYEFASTGGGGIQFQHSISGNVTKRWLTLYKVTNWQQPQLDSLSVGGVVLTRNVDYMAYVDTTNHILYVNLFLGIVPSGAVLGEVNNGIVALSSLATLALAASGAAVSSGTDVLSMVMALGASGAAVSSGTDQLSTVMSLVGSGTQASTGTADFVILLAGYGSFSARQAPAQRVLAARGLWTRGGPFVAGPSQTGSQTLQLAASGVAVSSGTDALTAILQLGATGAAASSGAAVLSDLMALTATGAAVSSGTDALGLVMVLSAIGTQVSSGAGAIGAPAVSAGYFSQASRPGPANRKDPRFWLYKGALYAATLPVGALYQLDATGGAVSAGNAYFVLQDVSVMLGSLQSGWSMRAARSGWLIHTPENEEV